MVGQRQADDSSSALSPSPSSALSMAEEEDVRIHGTVMDDNDEPTSVAFHEQPEEEELASAPPAPAAAPPPAAARSSLSAVSNGTAQAPWPSASAVAAAPSAPLPTIKPVNILATSTPVINTADSLPSSSASPRLSYVYVPTPTAASGRVSAYALSLLSSGSIFRSYKLNTVSNQIEFQDIKLYAIFPAAIIAASSHSTASGPPMPSSSPPTPSASSPPAPSVATLYWGPPNTRTSLPSSHHIALTSITDIFKGKKSLLFHSPSPLVALLSNSRCFSIASPEASLHLEALTEQIREEWISRIVEILRVIGGKRLEFSHADEGRRRRRGERRRGGSGCSTCNSSRRSSRSSCRSRRQPAATWATASPSTAAPPTAPPSLPPPPSPLCLCPTPPSSSATCAW